MPSIFSKNCVVAGAIDYYCLLCAKPLKTEEEAIAHINESHHKTRLSLTGYCEKYKDDRIKKIKSLYFCEWCNTTFPTAIKVELHVGEDNHIEKKTIGEKITRINNNIVASGSIVIDEDTWNGIVDDNCVLCSVEVDNKMTHNSSQSHMLNLIKSEVIFGQHGIIYREIDAGFFQCLNCNLMLSQNELTQHFQTTRHTDLMLEYLKRLSCKMDTIEQTAFTNKTENIVQNTIENGKNTETVDVKKEEREALPFPTGMRSNGTEKTTLFTKPVLRNGKDQTTRPASVPSADKLETFAKNHGLSPNRADKSFYCKVCTRRIPATLEDLKTHVSSKGHQEKASNKACNIETLPTEPTKVPLEEFVEELAYFEYEKSLNVLVNNNFLIKADSLLLVGTYRNKWVCLACHMDLVFDKVFQHVYSKAHLEAMKKCLVVTSVKDEIIIQINYEFYLCSNCETLEKDWEDMLHHLQTEEHRINKSKAEKFLQKKKSELHKMVDCSNGIPYAVFQCPEFIARFKF